MFSVGCRLTFFLFGLGAACFRERAFGVCDGHRRHRFLRMLRLSIAI
jgi:hypothetical protein